MDKIEYRVRPVTRYIVTRYYDLTDANSDKSTGVEQRGEYDNAQTAYEVGYALCKAEHERIGWPPGDEGIQYPAAPTEPRPSLLPGAVTAVA